MAGKTPLVGSRVALLAVPGMLILSDMITSLPCWSPLPRKAARTLDPPDLGHLEQLLSATVGDELVLQHRKRS